MTALASRRAESADSSPRRRAPGQWRSFAAMNPVVEAAWVSLIGVGVGVTGTVAVARAGFVSTRRATDATNTAASENMRAQIDAASDNIKMQIEVGQRNRV